MPFNRFCLPTCAAKSAYRRVISGSVFAIKSGCRWYDCPTEYGPAQTIYNRFVRWAQRGVWERLFRALAGKGHPLEVQMIDSTQIKAHRSASSAKRGSKSRQSVARVAA